MTMAIAELNEFRVQGTVTGWPRQGRFQDGMPYLEISVENLTRMPIDGKPPMVGTFQLTVYGEDIQRFSTLAPGQQVLASGYLKSRAVTSQRSGDTYHRVSMAVRSLVLLPQQYQQQGQYQQYQQPPQQYQQPPQQYQQPPQQYQQPPQQYQQPPQQYQQQGQQ
ncbi:MAG: hypothetical protein IJJ33_13625, partial [Victivallales bacterium]|nr:hypothetical protein [Victivallales bacterium]